MSGLPLCLVWSAPPDLFLLLFLFCPQLCGVGGGGGRAGGGGGGRRLLAFCVWPAFVRWHGGGWRLFAFGFGVVGWWWRLLAFGVRPAFVRWRGGWLVLVRLWFWCSWLVVGVFLAFGVRPAFVRWRGGGWRLFAFGCGVVGWWWRLLACGGPVFARWVGGWRQFALVQSLLQVS